MYFFWKHVPEPEKRLQPWCCTTHLLHFLPQALRKLGLGGHCGEDEQRGPALWRNKNNWNKSWIANSKILNFLSLLEKKTFSFVQAKNMLSLYSCLRNTGMLSIWTPYLGYKAAKKIKWEFYSIKGRKKRDHVVQQTLLEAHRSSLLALLASSADGAWSLRHVCRMFPLEDL